MGVLNKQADKSDDEHDKEEDDAYVNENESEESSNN